MHRISRRRVLASGLATGALLGGVTQADTQVPSLQALAHAKGLRFGSSVGAGAPGSLAGSFHDRQYRRLLTQECALLVHENALKWYVVRTGPDAFDFGPADLVMDFADREGLAVRGHTLLWNRDEFIPDWLKSHDFGARPASEAERVMTDHIRTLVGRYRGRIRSWDVVNETVDPQTGRMRDTVFTRLLGDEVMDIAFAAAREADPDAQLVYNDYMGWDAGQEAHRDGVLSVLDGMAERGAPIDALGVQSHIWASPSDGETAFEARREAGWRDFLDAATGQGLDLLVTEFDVNDTNLPYEIAVRDRAIADLAERYLDIMVSYQQTRDVLVWGMADPYSWLQTLWPRPDGEPKRPCPYDGNFEPKPLRRAIARTFMNAAAR